MLGMLLTLLLLLSCSWFVSSDAQGPDGTVVWVLPHQLLIENNACRPASGYLDGANLSIKVGFSWMTVAYVKLAKTNNKQTGTNN